MNTQDIWSIAGAIIASIGGAGVIICAVSGFRLTAPYSEERRKAASEQAKQNGIHKKVVDLP